jgi:hypothetical protein
VAGAEDMVREVFAALDARDLDRFAYRALLGLFNAPARLRLGR